MSTLLHQTVTPMPTREKPHVPAGAPEGMRVVRTRTVAADGTHRWALAVRLTAGNISDVADQSGWRRFVTEEKRTGDRSICLEDGDQRLTYGDWFLVVGDSWTGYRDRDMNQSFTSVRGGVLSGR